MPLCSFYASTSLPVAKPHSLPSSTKLPSTAAAAITTTVQPTTSPVLEAVATMLPTKTASTAAEALSLHLPELPSSMRDKILSLELMGVDYGRALTLNPALRDASPESIHAVVTFLQSRGLHFKDLGRVFGMCPSVLTASVRTDLRPVFTFLSEDLGVPEPRGRLPPRHRQVPAPARLQRPRPAPPGAHLPPPLGIPGQPRAGVPGPHPPRVQRGAHHGSQAGVPADRAGHVQGRGGGHGAPVPGPVHLQRGAELQAQVRVPGAGDGRRRRGRQGLPAVLHLQPREADRAAAPGSCRGWRGAAAAGHAQGHRRRVQGDDREKELMKQTRPA